MNIFTIDKLDYYKFDKDISKFKHYPKKAKQVSVLDCPVAKYNEQAQ